MKYLMIAPLPMLVLLFAGCGSLQVQWVTEEFDTPGAVLAAYTNANDAKLVADGILHDAVNILSEQGFVVDPDPRWHWNYYKEKNIIWFQYVTFKDKTSGNHIGFFQCNVVESLSPDLWILTVQPFPVGPARGSPKALAFYSNVIEHATQKIGKENANKFLEGIR